jgi:hypothetical protein
VTGPRFDAVVEIKLGRRGVRELVLQDGMLWGIAGPATDDGKEDYAIWSLPVEKLKDAAANGTVLEPASWHVTEPALPKSSEGLVLDGEHAIVIVDGDKGDGADCKEAAKQVRVRFTKK